MGWMTRGIGALWPSRAAGASTSLAGVSPRTEFFFTSLGAAGGEAFAGAPGCPTLASFARVGVLMVADFLVALALFASALAIESASHSFFVEPPAAETLRLLFHSAEPASPAISSMVRWVSTE